MTASSILGANGLPSRAARDLYPLPALPVRFRFTPEFQLLVACSLIPPTLYEQFHAEKIVSLCVAAIDWDAFISLVDRHHVHGPVYATLCRCAAERLPDRVRDRLKRRRIQVCGRALRHAAELARLIPAFAAQRIGVISLKGVALSLRLFGDPGMRHTLDIDLLVSPEDLVRGDRLLKANGYRCIFPDFEITQKIQERILSQDHHRTYWHDDLQVRVELHWRIDQWTPENVEELWSHCEKTDWMGTTINQLDDDALLLFLCSHGAGHKWSCLKWLSDVAALMALGRATTSDNLLDMTIRFGLERALAQTALMVHWLYGTRLAEPLCELIQKERLSRNLASEALQVTLMNECDLLASERFGRLKYLRYTLRLRRRLPFHVYMGQALISTSYFNEFSLPDRLFWLHYPLRPLIWLKRHYTKQESS